MEQNGAKITKWNNKLFTIWLLSALLESYALFFYKTFPVTPFTVVTILVILKSFGDFLVRRSLKLNRTQLAALLMIVWIIIVTCATGAKNIYSTILLLHFFAVYVVFRRTETTESFEEHIHIFSVIMTIMAIYGIYQPFGRLAGHGFANLIIEGHMVEGFNWGNQISLFGIRIYRSNAIFLEPSFFSQYVAINILIIVDDILKKGGNLKKYLLIAINGLGMISAFAGTGFIVLFGGALIYWVKLKKNIRVILRTALLGVAAIAVAAVILLSPIGEHFLHRATEVVTYQAGSYSGYSRFRSGLDVWREAWKDSPVFGIGLGLTDEYIHSLPNYYEGMAYNGFYRIPIELGLVGMIIMLVFILKQINSKRFNNKGIVIQAVLFPLIISSGGSYYSNSIWFFMYLLNCKIVVLSSEATVEKPRLPKKGTVIMPLMKESFRF